MKRELKFRLWTGKEMDNWFHLDSDGTGAFQCSSGSYGDEMSMMLGYSDSMGEGLHIMQYINKKDKDGKEIYEGDVLQCEMLIVKVEWQSNASFGLIDLSTDREVTMPYGETLQHFTLIGNIYQGYTEIDLHPTI